MNWKKQILIALLINFLFSVIPQQSLAGEQGIFLNLSTARGVVTELSVCRIEVPYYKKQLPLVTTERDLLKEKSDLLVKTNTNLSIDLADVTKQKEEFKASYIKTNEDLSKVRESIPSRMTWFGAGAIATAIVVIIGIFSIK